MEKHIRLLECTLRDGGHIVQGQFSESTIKHTIEKLVEARTDIIEVGFLWDSRNSIDTARYYSIEDVRRVLPKNLGISKISLMADFIDLEHIEPCDGTVEIIRLSFKRWRLDWGLKTAKILMDKGYKVFINPVNNNVYSDKEYIEVLEKVNELHPYGFSIVDTFGAMRVSDLLHRYYLVENNLSKDIVIGFHFHENLGLAYSLAQAAIQNANPNRSIVIDGSLLGMGRVPGNLCIEQIMDYMNDQMGASYQIEPVYDAIDDYIAPIKATNPWGYAIPYALSAKYYLHRTYAEFLSGKKRLKTKDIQRILAQVDVEKAETYDEAYIDGLYKAYLDVSFDDKSNIERLKDKLSSYKRIVVIAPGASIKNSKIDICNSIDDDTCVISVNFLPSYTFCKPNYVFLTNTKRLDDVMNKIDDTELIITSNLLRDVTNTATTVEYNTVAYFNDDYCEDSTLMLLNLLSRIGIKQVFLAGFDGRKNGKLEFVDDSMDRNQWSNSDTVKVKNILNSTLKDLEKVFITESVYNK